jgi:cytidylate kinase
MAVITISRQYGSGGDEVAFRVCELLGYLYFDKRLMLQLVKDVGLAPGEAVEFSAENHKVQSFLERLFSWYSSRVVARAGTWTEVTSGAKKEAVEELDQARSVAFVQRTIQAAYNQGNMVIVGRGGQAILKDKPDVLHVRIEAPLEARNLRIHEQQKVNLGYAQDIVVTHDQTAADYLKHFYDIDWADPKHYDLVINMGKLGIEAAAQLIVKAVNYLPRVSVN